MRKLGVCAIGVVLMLVTSACGTRLPDSAFVAAGDQPGGSTASGAKSTTAAKAATSTTVAGAAGGTAATTPGANPAAAAAGGPAAAGGDPAAAAAAGADGPNQASDTGVTENEIVIGNITAQDGILGAAFRPPQLGLQAYVQWINDQGGVHGRKLRLETCNDKEDRTRALQCAQDLVENKHVFAFIANNTRAEGGAAPYINQQGVPVLDIPITNASYRWPHYWTIYGTGCPRDGNTVCVNDQIRNTSAPYRWFKENVGVKKAGVFYYGLIGESKQAGDFTITGLQKEGYEVTGYDVNFASPNFDQAVQDMKNNGVDSIFDVIDDGANRKLCDTMQRYGFTVKAKVSTVVSYGDEIGQDFSDACRNSIYIAGSTVSYDNVANPAVKEFRDAYATYQPDAPLHQWALEGWMAGKELVDALGTMGPAPTRAGFEAWLGALSKYTNGGLSSPIDYQPKDLQAPTADGECLTVAQWQDDQKGWVDRTDPYQCYDGVAQYLTAVSERGD